MAAANSAAINSPETPLGSPRRMKVGRRRSLAESFGQERGVGGLAGEETEADEEQRADDKEVHPGIEEEGAGDAAGGGNGHHALHGGLVGAVVLHELEKVADAHDPSAHGGEREMPVGHLQVAVVAGEGQDAGRAAGGAGREGRDEPSDAADHQDELDHVRPDHGGETAQHGVERGQQPHREDAEGQGNARDDREGEGGGIEDQTKPAQAREDEKARGGGTGARAEPLRDVLVGGGHPQAVVEWIEQRHEHGRDQHAGEADDDERDVLAVRRSRQRHEGDRARERGVHAHAHRQPGHPAAAEEEVLRVLLLASNEQADAQHGEEVDAEDRVVQRTEGGRFHDGNCIPLSSWISSICECVPGVLL